MIAGEREITPNKNFAFTDFSANGSPNSSGSEETDLDLIGLFMKEANRFKLLTLREEKILGSRIFVGIIAMKALERISSLDNLDHQVKRDISKVLENPSCQFIISSQKTEDKVNKLVDEAERDNEIEDEKENKLKKLKKLPEIIGNYNRWLDLQLETAESFGGESLKEDRLREITNFNMDFANRGIESYEEMVQHNLRLVVSVSKRYRQRGLEAEDLIGYGFEGLMKAAARFDFRMGYKFSTYATHWLKQRVRKAAADYGSTIRIPVHLGEQVNKHLRAGGGSDGFNPLTELERLALNARRVQDLQLTVGDNLNLENAIAGTDNVEGEVGRRMLAEQIRGMLLALEPRMREVIEKRFGIDGKEAKTLEEIGHERGVTRERIRQIESQALKSLRDNLGPDSRLSDFLGEQEG